MRHSLQFALTWIVTTALLISFIKPGQAQNRTSPQAWTLEEALAQLRLYPQDAYLQYVALQLARRGNRLAEVAGQIEQIIGNERFRRAEGRRDQVDLFSLFTGALAVQESLQLDAMRDGMPGDELQHPSLRGIPPEMRREVRQSPEWRERFEQQEREQLAARQKEQAELEKRRREMTPVAALSGPTVKSHPWEQLLAGRRPEISPLARYVPEDFYFIEFRSLGKLLDVVETSDLWSTHLFNQVFREARTPRVGERLKQQLALETNPQLQPFYDLAVEEVAVTGSDPFLREGSDVSVLFRVKAAAAFQAQMERFLANAERARPDAKRVKGKYLGVEYTQLATPDREINVFTADPAPGLHLRSNSWVAFQRLIRAVQGRTVKRLGESAEFAYIRTLMPRGATEEDGIIYLSDPFIRRLVGPQLKLTERRRVICYNHLRMIGHAALLYRTETGGPPKSLAALAEAQCAPGLFGAGILACPDSGQYSIAADGMTGVCSRHGHAQFLTPCLEIPVAEVSGAEADEYKAFLSEYNQYWRTYFDPIALRVQLTPKRFRVETVILPLIDNSIYTRLAETLGGEPEPLDALPVPNRNIFSLAFRLNKDALLAGPKRRPADATGRTNPLTFLGLSDATAERLDLNEFLSRGLGNQVSLHVYDAHPTFDLNLPALTGMLAAMFSSREASLGGAELMIGAGIIALNSPVYVAMPVQDTQVVDRFLERVDAELAAGARKREGISFLSLDQDFYRFQLQQGQAARSFSLRFGPIKLRVFWARIGDGLYLASKPFILDDLYAAAAKPADTGAASISDRGPAGHALARIRPQSWNQVLTDFQLGWAENNREACLNNLGPLSSIGRTFIPPVPKTDQRSASASEDLARTVREFADKLQAVHSFCPEGGQYGLAPDGKAFLCSVHGSAQFPRQPAAPTETNALGKLMRELADLTATITFLPEGLRAVVTIERKEKISR